MNRIYRVVWNAGKGVWQAASEFGSGPAKALSCRAARRRGLALLGLTLTASSAFAGAALPTGGNVVAGQASIAQAGSGMTITQSTSRAAIEWQGFSIGQGNTVNFVQPSKDAVALNRVLGADASTIQGALKANGQVFLVNPNGILFSPSAQVNVGGLVASTLQISNEDFLAGRYQFSGGSSNAIVNQGNLQAANGGNIALIAAKISNTGTIAADAGNVLLGAGSQVLLDFGGPVKLQVQQASVDTLIENGGALRADGGTIYLSAKSAGDLASSVINNTGIVQARTLATGEQGKILLIGDMQHGNLNLGGTLDASAPVGGNGGAIETSAATVSTASGLVVNAGAAQGSGGQWLVDPYDYTINAAAATTISGALNTGTSVTVSTQSGNASYGSTGTGNGDITVASAITKSAGGNASLTLLADRNITVNGDISSTSGKLDLTLSSANAAGATVGGIDVNANLKSNGGNILIGGGNGTVTNGIGYALNYSASTAAVSVEQGKSILSQGGNITINGKSLVGSSSGNYAGDTGGVYIKSNATILSGAGNLFVTGESDGGTHTFGLAFEGNSNTLTTVGSAPAGGNMLLNAINATPGSYTADTLAQGAIGLVSYGNRARIAFQGPSVAAWLVYVNGAPQLSAYTQSPQLSSCATPYPNCGTLVVPGSNNSYLYATYQAVDMSTLPLYVIQSGSASKIYDGSTIASGLNYTLIGQPTGFNVGNLSPAPIFTSSSKNVGTYASLTPSASNAKDYTSGSMTYAVAYYSNGTYTITPKSLTPSAGDKVYDGTATAAVTASGIVAGDNVSLNGTGSFGGKDVGQYTVSIANITLSGADAGNYTLSGNSASATANINRRTVTVAASKTYDGSASMANAVTLGNLVAGEDLSYSGAMANSANVSDARYISGITLGDGLFGLASNYQLPSLNAASSGNTASVTPKALTVTGMTAQGKTYDGTTFAALSGGTLSGLVTGETVTITGESGSFADKNAGTNKAVTVTGVALGDGLNGLASNYTVTNPTGLTASIDRRTLAISGLNAAGKTYDGTTTATIDSTGLSLSGLISGDTVNVAATGTFADPNAGTGKLVNLTSTLSGADAGNYTSSGQTTATATITQKALTISGMMAQGKTYDGTTVATLSGGTLAGLANGESLDFSGQTGSFADKNAGTNKAVTVTGITLSDGTGLASNYTITNPTGLSASIAPKALTVSGITAADKTYDGSTSATINIANLQLAGLVQGDAVNVTASGSFANRDAGNGKTVNLASTYSGADAGNYNITAQPSTTASILAKALNVAGTVVADKTYDGTTAATLVSPGTLDGVVTGDDIALNAAHAQASFAQTAPGSGIAVNVTGLALQGANAANYRIDGSANASASILAAAAVQVPATPISTPNPTPAAAVPPPAVPTQNPVAATTNAAQLIVAQQPAPTPSAGALNYLAVPETANPVAATSASANPAGASGGANAVNAGADSSASQGGDAPAVLANKQSATQGLTAGRDVRFLNVFVVSGGIRMPEAAASSGTNSTGGTNSN